MLELKNQEIIKYNIPDKNGRVYTKGFITNKEVIEEQINRKCCFGIFEFKANNDCRQINIMDVSHAVENLKETDDGLYCDITILDTVQGKIVQALINNDIVLVPVLSGLGTLETIPSCENIFKVKNYILTSVNLAQKNLEA